MSPAVEMSAASTCRQPAQFDAFGHLSDNVVLENSRRCGAYGITQLPQSHSTLAGIQAVSGCAIAI
jgi:hypothetical protein